MHSVFRTANRDCSSKRMPPISLRLLNNPADFHGDIPFITRGKAVRGIEIGFLRRRIRLDRDRQSR